MLRQFSGARTVGLCALMTIPVGAFVAFRVETMTAAANPAARLVVPGRDRATGADQAGRNPIGRAASRRNVDPVLAENVALLEAGIKFLKKSPGYTATFCKREVLNGALRDDLETIDLKLRHQPHSVYMKWRDSKEEVLFVEGRNGNKLRVHHVGFKSLLGDLDIAPDSALAMTESRHPITEAGMLNLASTILSYRTRDVSSPGQVTLRELPGEKVGGRSCRCFVAEYADPHVEPTYRKTIYCLDREWSIPVSLKAYGWVNGKQPGSDEASLFEQYEYRDIKFCSLADADFDCCNAAYAFKQ